ncbi:MAG: histidine phosphatase family protein [Halieaceae bacterium]
MSKQLLLLRHAKSSWSDESLGDRERGLNNRGRRNAPMMGRALAAVLEPQVVYVSPALRAQRTLGGLQDGWPGLQELEHITEEALYTFSAQELVDWIRSRENAPDSLFLIGHNPALTDLVNWVCGETVLPNLPTAGFAQLQLNIERWPDLAPGCGRLQQRLFPKELPDA